MRVTRYRGRHLRPKPKRHRPAAVGTAAAVWLAGPVAHAAVHLVRRGETLSSIAQSYGTTVQALAQANRLRDPNFIIAGSKLIVASSAGGVAAAAVHEVAPGETLSSIAQRYGTTVQALAQANHLADPNFITSGSNLSVPPGGATTTVSATGVETLLETSAARHEVDASLVKAVAYNESGWQQGVTSEAGAIGVMQVMPDTADFVNEVLGDGSLNVRSSVGNVELGVMYLRHMLDSQPTEDRALAAYFSGPGNVRGRLDSAQRHYVSNVQSLRSRF